MVKGYSVQPVGSMKISGKAFPMNVRISLDRVHELTVVGLYLEALLRAMELCDGRDHLLVGGGALL